MIPIPSVLRPGSARTGGVAAKIVVCAGFDSWGAELGFGVPRN
jgi:hypothetical protein